MSGAAVELDGIRFAYGGTAFVLDLRVGAGDVAAIIGPSGAGKSTLLNLIAGFETPSEGRVLIDGRDVKGLPPAARPVSMVFQDNNLFAHLDVATNVALGIAPSGRPTAAEKRVVADALARLGLAGMAGRYPGELSGGERGRVALARATLRDRPVLLLDEPLAALGPALRADMLDLLRALHKTHGMTVLIVTHQPDDARALATHTAFVAGGRVAAYRETAALFGATDVPELADYLGQGDAHADNE